MPPGGGLGSKRVRGTERPVPLNREWIESPAPLDRDLSVSEVSTGNVTIFMRQPAFLAPYVGSKKQARPGESRSPAARDRRGVADREHMRAPRHSMSTHAPRPAAPHAFRMRGLANRQVRSLTSYILHDPPNRGGSTMYALVQLRRRTIQLQSFRLRDRLLSERHGSVIASAARTAHAQP